MCVCVCSARWWCWMFSGSWARCFDLIIIYLFTVISCQQFIGNGATWLRWAECRLPNFVWVLVRVKTCDRYFYIIYLKNITCTLWHVYHRRQTHKSNWFSHGQWTSDISSTSTATVSSIQCDVDKTEKNRLETKTDTSYRIVLHAATHTHTRRWFEKCWLHYTLLSHSMNKLCSSRCNEIETTINDLRQ